MADGFDLDFSQLSRLQADFGNVPANVGPKFRSAVGRTAQRTRDSWRQKLYGSETVPLMAQTISYEFSNFQGFGASVLKVEIGPENGGQGSLGHLIEYGSPTSPPRGYGHAALEENATDFEEGIAKAAVDALREQTVGSSLLGNAGAVIRGSIL